MTKTPLSGNTDQVTFTILAGGKQVSDLYQVHAIETSKEINKIPFARILIYDGSPDEADFTISDSTVFIPGEAIEIKAGYESEESTIFKGIIVKHSVKIQRTGASFLVVDVMDKALKMTLERKCDLYPQIRDSDLIGKLITANGLAKDVENTPFVNDQIVQYNATDWDLMLLRAEINSLLVIVEDGKLSVKKPDTSQDPVLEIAYGDTLLDFQAEMDASTQLDDAAVQGYAWDMATLNLVQSGAGRVSSPQQGNLSSAKLAEVFGIKKYPLQSAGNIADKSLESWATAGLQKSKLSKIRGTVKFQGNASVLPGKLVTLSGVGNRFNGDAFVSAVFHRIENGNWITELHFGMSFTWFSAEAKNIAAPPASGQLPPIKGLQTGIVKKVDADPDGEFRVLVNFPLLQNKNKSIWTRLGSFYANNKTGAFFFPELEDEVVVGFFNEDPRYPVILGCLYSKKMAPPLTPDAQNNKKAIVTRANLQISFDDKDKIIEIKTPGGHTISMNDKSGELSVKDSNKNSILLSKSGISLDSDKGIKINAKGNIDISSSANITLSAKVNLNMEGSQINNTAKTKFSAKGNATAELTASGIVTVKGGMVKIN